MTDDAHTKDRLCPDVDEYHCAECDGHNRCEDEMNAGFGVYEAPDVDR